MDAVASVTLAIRRGHNALGGKQQLFVKALQKYDRDHLAKLEALDNPKKAIATFFDNTVAKTVADQDHKGCFLFNTALQINTHDEEVNAIVTNGAREIEASFRCSIEVGQARGKERELDNFPK